MVFRKLSSKYVRTSGSKSKGRGCMYKTCTQILKCTVKHLCWNIYSLHPERPTVRGLHTPQWEMRIMDTTCSDLAVTKPPLLPTDCLINRPGCWWPWISLQNKWGRLKPLRGRAVEEGLAWMNNFWGINSFLFRCFIVIVVDDKNCCININLKAQRSSRWSFVFLHRSLTQVGIWRLNQCPHSHYNLFFF